MDKRNLQLIAVYFLGVFYIANFSGGGEILMTESTNITSNHAYGHIRNITLLCPEFFRTNLPALEEIKVSKMQSRQFVILNGSNQEHARLSYTYHVGNDNENFTASWHGDMIQLHKVLSSNEEFCRSNPNLKYIFYVYTSPPHRLRRDWIRGRWGRRDYLRHNASSVLFVLGRSASENVTQACIAESKLYEDMVIADFTDDYNSLVLKGIAALKWITTFCTNAKYVIKTDDDMFLNVFQIAQVIERQILMNDTIQNKMLCSYYPKSGVIRHDSKWAVPAHQFPSIEFYPPYCSGYMNGMTLAIASRLVTLATRTPCYDLEHVFLTALLVQQVTDLDISYIDITRRYVYRDSYPWIVQSASWVGMRRGAVGLPPNGGELERRAHVGAVTHVEQNAPRVRATFLELLGNELHAWFT